MKRSKRQSSAVKAGLVFPVSRIRRYLRSTSLMSHFRQSAGAAVYTTAVLEYLTAEFLELAGGIAKSWKVKLIKPRHLMLAMKQDEELLKLCQHVILPNCGVVPQIHSALVPSHKIAKVSSTARAATKKPPPMKRVIAAPKKKPAKLVKKGSTLTCLGEKTLFLGQKLTVVKGDITKVTADAAIHPTSSSYSTSGQVGGALSRVGGESFKEELAKMRIIKPSINVTEVFMSGAGKKLPFSYVIHVNSPSWSSGTNDNNVQQLQKAIENILNVAEEKKLQSLAIPSVSSGNAGFPKQLAAETILRAINSYFASKVSSSIKQVYFVLYDQESVDVYNAELGRLV